MKIILPGKPIPKMRARYSKRGSFVVTYDPQEADKKEVKKQIEKALCDQINYSDNNTSHEVTRVCLGRVFQIEFWFYLPINKSDSIGERNAKLWGITHATCKPDYDNLEKFYLDCLNGTLWGDDSMVVDSKAHKRYSDNPRVEIDITVKKSISLADKELKILQLVSPKELMEMMLDIKDMTSFLDAIGHGDVENIPEWVLMDLTHELSRYSLKYATLFKKIEKFGDIKKEYEQRNKLKKEIEDGKHNI
jgi:Holliday junction resolvase RusA-like endonuclease